MVPNPHIIEIERTFVRDEIEGYYVDAMHRFIQAAVAHNWTINVKCSAYTPYLTTGLSTGSLAE